MLQIEKKVLVIGGAGYVGSHCSYELHKSGYSPIVFDNLSTGHREFVKWGSLIEGDILNYEEIFSAIQQTQPFAVIHFAALALVGESVENPSKYWRVNTFGTLNLLDAMKNSGLSNLVFSSTCAVYGSPHVETIDEDTQKNPVNPYGASKLAAEKILSDFSFAYGIKSVSLRYFNACGAMPSEGLGEDRENETHLIPLILDAASGRRKSISIFGTDYPTADGTAVRDYVHVLDLAKAHVSALEYLEKGGDTVSLNLGTGKGHSVAEVISVAENVVGRPINTVVSSRRAGDPPKLIADPQKASEILKWQPVRSEIGEVVKDAWAWHKTRFKTNGSSTAT